MPTQQLETNINSDESKPITLEKTTKTEETSTKQPETVPLPSETKRVEPSKPIKKQTKNKITPAKSSQKTNNLEIDLTNTTPTKPKDEKKKQKTEKVVLKVKSLP